MNVRSATLAAALVLAPAALFAQSVAPPAPTLRPSQATSRTIQQRKADQANRIGNGVRSGQLTARETAHLEHQEAGINREQRGMLAQNNGHLTQFDRRTIDRQQNVESRRIDRDKHDAAVR